MYLLQLHNKFFKITFHTFQNLWSQLKITVETNYNQQKINFHTNQYILQLAELAVVMRDDLVAFSMENTHLTCA